MSVVDQPRKAAARKNAPVDLQEFLNGLLEAGRIDKATVDMAVKGRRRAEDRSKHVLIYVADLELEDQKSPGRKLDIESLTQELGRQSGQAYYRI
ncbi:MAG: type II/IV secretion system protein, partial [Gammaproteobacteria bacterium]